MARTRLSQTTKVMQCRVCGCDMVVNGYQRNQPRCRECGITETVRNAIELHRHSGPAYERWRQAMARAAVRQEWGATPPAKTD